MENNIEEDIKILENFINWLKTDFEYNSGEEIKAIEHILSDYKRVLKELDKQQTTINKYTKEIEKAVTKCNELENENKELKKDISNMYDEEVIISIISDNFNLSRNEVLKLLGGE